MSSLNKPDNALDQIRVKSLPNTLRPQHLSKSLAFFDARLAPRAPVLLERQRAPPSLHSAQAAIPFVKTNKKVGREERGTAMRKCRIARALTAAQLRLPVENSETHRRLGHRFAVRLHGALAFRAVDYVE